MRILLLTRSFNSLTQRLYVELAALGHTLSVEFDVNDSVSIEAVAMFRPDLVLAPYLTRKIPAAMWQAVTTLVIHPGPVGDRGPSALDWAILDGAPRWGVTLIEAREELDAGPVWATVEFDTRPTSKSELYRDEVTDAAVACALSGLARLEAGAGPLPDQPDFSAGEGWRARVSADDRAIAWDRDDTETVLRKLRSADGQPGVRDVIDGRTFQLYDGHAEDVLKGVPGAFIARRDEAVCRATVDGAVWIGAMKPRSLDGEPSFKRTALDALGAVARALPEIPDPGDASFRTWRPIRYVEEGDIGFLHFDIYNGAMSTAVCRRLLAAYRAATARPTHALVLMGGEAFWSNGLDLATIEAAASPADESMANIEAMDDLAEAIITTTDKLTVAVMRGNAGAGGVFLALAADVVMARTGVVLNPHYKNMGNLYGSEYWTYLLPRRLKAGTEDVMGNRLPVGVERARALGLVDEVLPRDRGECVEAAKTRVRALVDDPGFAARLADKAATRAADEAAKPLAAYRAEELERMRRNFYGFDPSYHVARWHFIAKLPLARTPVHLARHRETLSNPAAAPVEGGTVSKG